MAKLSQADVKAKADEWVKIQRALGKCRGQMNTDLVPIEEKYRKAAQPILDLHEAKIGKLETKAAQLEGEVLEWLTSQNKVMLLDGACWEAANELKEGSRSINPERFFSKVKLRTAEFWACVTIGIQKADKFLGKDAVDEMATKADPKLVASLRLRSK